MEGIQLDSVVANRGLNGGYYGSGQRGNGGYDGSVVNANVLANRDAQLISSINDASSEQFMSDRITSGHASITGAVTQGNNFLSDRIWSQSIDTKFANVTAQFASAERVAFSNQAAIDRQLHAMELKQVECCCELKAASASIEAKVDGQNQAALAVTTALQGAKLDALLLQGGRPGNS